MQNPVSWRQSRAASPFCDVKRTTMLLSPRPSRAEPGLGLEPLFLSSSALTTRSISHCSTSACQAVCACVLAATAVEGGTLAELPLVPILNTQGLILPTVPEDTQATIFAIFDEGKKIQYIGFSKDCRNSLRTVFTRRPDKAFFYKALHLPTLDQKAMLDIRSSWFEEIGGQPNGNRLAIERNQWQLPISSGAISERGKQQAAEKEVEMLRTMFKSRGCTEDLVPDPELLADGKVDFLPAKALTEEELERQKELMASRSQNLRNVVAVIDGVKTDFEILIEASYKTKGGYFFDVKVTYEERMTTHRVIVGKEYYEDFDIRPEQALERAFAYLLGKKVQRQTEGLMMHGEFPINYFSMSTIEQYFDDFAEAFVDTGKQLRGDSKFWRFSRIHTYGAQAAKKRIPANSAISQS